MGGGGRSSGGGQQQQQGVVRRINPIRPVTINQILTANNDVSAVLVVDGRELTQATVIGRIISYESANMNVGAGALTARHFGYRVSDNTGIMVVRQWVEAESVEEPIPVGCHVRASGTLKVWQGTPVVTGTVTAIADSNELNYHLLDAILTHLRLTRGNHHPNSNSSSASVKNSAAAGNGGVIKNTAAAVGFQNLLPGGSDDVPVTDLIVDAIRKNGNGDIGLSIDDIVAALKKYNVTVTDVRGALRVLAGEGQIYQTHDSRFNI